MERNAHSPPLSIKHNNGATHTHTQSSFFLERVCVTIAGCVSPHSLITIALDGDDSPCLGGYSGAPLIRTS